jgi:hypothetical protein
MGKNSYNKGKVLSPEIHRCIIPVTVNQYFEENIVSVFRVEE